MPNYIRLADISLPRRYIPYKSYELRVCDLKQNKIVAICRETHFSKALIPRYLQKKKIRAGRKRCLIRILCVLKFIIKKHSFAMLKSKLDIAMIYKNIWACKSATRWCSFIRGQRHLLAHHYVDLYNERAAMRLQTKTHAATKHIQPKHK